MRRGGSISSAYVFLSRFQNDRQQCSSDGVESAIVGRSGARDAASSSVNGLAGMQLIFASKDQPCSNLNLVGVIHLQQP